MDRGATSRSPLRRWLVAAPVVALLLLGAIVAYTDHEAAETVGFLGIVLGQYVGGVLVFRRSRDLQRRERNAWRFFGLALFLAATGVLAVGILTELGVDIPAFGWPDIFFLSGYAMLFVTFIRLARADGGGTDWLPTLIDALMGGIALAVLVWTNFFSDLLHSFDDAPVWELAIAAAYPVMDIAAAVGLMIMIIRRSNFHNDIRLAFLAFGIATQVVADFIFFSSGVGKTFAEAEPQFGLLLVATACYVMVGAMVDQVPAKREFPERDAPIWAVIWPYLLVAGLIASHLSGFVSLSPSTNEVLLLSASLLIGVIIFLRQLLMISRNRSYVENQRSELVASVSHELRTPLTAIVGYLNVLDQDADDFPESARREMISEATDQAHHLSRLVSDLVMLAKGDHRHLPLVFEDVSISELAGATLRGVEPANTKIESEIGSDALVRVDADRMQQALSNLLSNAVRYGNGEALMSLHVDGADLVVEVHDNGKGVPTRYESMIWQRFERGEHRLDATTPGLGIGLAIVEAVAVSHGGQAEYQRSERLGGAKFSVVIPGCVISQRHPDRVEVTS